MSQNENKLDSVSYSLGLMVTRNLKDQGFTKIDMESFMVAMADVLSNNPPKVSVEMANQILNQAVAEQQANVHKDNKEAGEAFLAANASREGINVLESGVQYEVLRAGDGPKPKATDKVRVHYHGTLIDGKVFDSSVERGQTISFPVNGVIQGWQEILQLMPVGSKWKVYIPYHQAYGERGAGADIKPFSALIFEIDLIGIE